MNNYSFEEINVGLEESFSVQVTNEVMNQFYSITGDDNPLHNDAEYAVCEGYKDRVVFGMLTASYLSTLAGVYLPGRRSLIHSVETKMVKPVFINDILTIKGKVVEKSESLPVFVMNVTIRNQDDQLVMRGRMQVGVLDEK